MVNSLLVSATSRTSPYQTSSHSAEIPLTFRPNIPLASRHLPKVHFPSNFPINPAENPRYFAHPAQSQNIYKIKNGNLILTLCEYKFSRKELSRRDISHSYDVVLAAVMKNSVWNSVTRVFLVSSRNYNWLWNMKPVKITSFSSVK